MKIRRLFFTVVLCGIWILSERGWSEEAVLPPVGFHAVTLEQGFNVIGVNVVNAPLVTGTLSGVDGMRLTDTTTDFGETVKEGEFTIEFDAGPWSPIASVEGGTIVTPEDLSDSVDVGDRYVVRQVKTVQELFGTVDETPLKGGIGVVGDSDIVWVPDSEGGFVKLYPVKRDPFFQTGWRDVAGIDEDPADFPIHFTKGLLIERIGEEPVTLRFEGFVKTTPTRVQVNDAFSFLSRLFPSGSTLKNSGLYQSDNTGVQDGVGPLGADILWNPIGPGAFEKFYYSKSDGFFLTEGWKNVEKGDEDQSEAPLSSGYILERGEEPSSVTVTPPPFYMDL